MIANKLYNYFHPDIRGKALPLQEKPFEVSVLGWAAHAPGLECREDWQRWAEHGHTPTDHPSKPDLPQIPAMLRRRLSPMGKSALWSCYQLLNDFSDTPPTIFCSQHGEVQETVKLLKELATGQALSPTAFSLSVHNASAGIHSIARNATANISAISAGPDSCCAAMLEAYSLLETRAHDRVLCVIYDSPLPDIYQSDRAAPECPVSLALLLAPPAANAAELSLEFHLHSNTGKPQTELPLMAFIRMLLAASHADTELDITSDRRHWHWRARSLAR